MSFDISFMTHSAYTFAHVENDFHKLLSAELDCSLCGEFIGDYSVPSSLFLTQLCLCFDKLCFEYSIADGLRELDLVRHIFLHFNCSNVKGVDSF